MARDNIKKRVYLTYAASVIKEPIVCMMYEATGVRFNLRSASVTEEIGIIGMELIGDPDQIAEAIAFFRERGVRVEPIEMDVIAG